MRTIVLIVAVSVFTVPALAQYGGHGQRNSGSYGNYGYGSNSRSHTVQPHINSQGTYVPGHQRTNPNRTQMDNYGARGNVNPYTGQQGTRTPRW